MPTVTVKQQLSTHQQMAVLGQYTESGIKVMVSDVQGEGREIGHISQLIPMNDSFTVGFTYKVGVKPLKRTQLDGFVFSNFYGRYFLSKPLGG